MQSDFASTVAQNYIDFSFWTPHTFSTQCLFCCSLKQNYNFASKTEPAIRTQSMRRRVLECKKKSAIS